MLFNQCYNGNPEAWKDGHEKHGEGSFTVTCNIQLDLLQIDAWFLWSLIDNRPIIESNHDSGKRQTRVRQVIELNV